MKEIIKKCNSYDKQVGCYHTFDGKCNKENCQVYNLLQENEKLKTQYNCYACGNCKGKEDYINLEKHHKGLRKVFDKLHTENEKLKEEVENFKKMFEEQFEYKEINLKKIEKLKEEIKQLTE